MVSSRLMTALRDWRFHRNFWVLILTWILFKFERDISFTFLPDYIVALGGSEAAIGLASMIGQLFFIPVGIMGGYIGDYYGRRDIVVKMTWAIAFSTLLYVIAPTWWFIPVALSIESLSRVYIPALHAIFADSMKPEVRAKGFMMSHILPDVLALPAPALGGFIIEYLGYGKPFSYRVVYIIAFSMSLIAALIRHLMLVETLSGYRRAPLLKVLIESLRLGVKDFIKTIPLAPKAAIAISLLNSIFYMLPLGMVLPYMIRYAGLNGIDSGTWGTIISITIGVSVIVGIVMLRILDLIDRRVLLILSILGFSLGLYMFSRGDFNSILFGTIMYYGVFSRIYDAAYFAYISDVTARGMRSRVLAFSDIGGALGGASGAFIASIIYSVNPQALFVTASLLSICMLVPLAFLPPITKVEE